MLIAHLSDFHVFSRLPETPHVRTDIASVVERIVADVAAFRPSIDAVMITGDVADGGSAEDYALVRRLLAPLRMPVYVVPGNHDRRDTLRSAFADRQDFQPGPFLNFTARLGPLRIVGLDSQVPGRVEGRLCAERLAWAARALAELHAARTLILMHHPPFVTGMGAVDAATLVEGAEELGILVAAQPGPVSLLCGHVHRPVQTVWNGAFAAIAGSPAFQQQLVFGLPEDPPTVREPYAYFIHDLADPRRMAIHTRYVGPSRET